VLRIEAHFGKVAARQPRGALGGALAIAAQEWRNMQLRLRFFTSITCLALALSACSAKTDPLSEQQVRDLTWQALEPSTSSHDLSNWEFIEVMQVVGHEVADQFAGEPAPVCWQGPTPPENATIKSDSSYWYVQMRPLSATPRPMPTEQFSPTAPPNVPEPFLNQADFLVDANTGRIVARKLSCAIY
jgi:hypothetical protein